MEIYMYRYRYKTKERGMTIGRQTRQQQQRHVRKHVDKTKIYVRYGVHLLWRLSSPRMISVDAELTSSTQSLCLQFKSEVRGTYEGTSILFYRRATRLRFLLKHELFFLVLSCNSLRL